MAVLALKTAEPGAQSRLIITGTNCGGTAEAERNVRPQLFTLIHTHLISFCRLAAYDGNFNKKCGTLWLILPKLCDFLLPMFCSTHCLIYIFVLQLHQLE